MNEENEKSFNGFAGFEEAPATKDETDDVVASEGPTSEDELSDFIDAGQVEETAETDSQAADIAITSNTDNNAKKAGDKDDDEDSFNGFAGFEEAPATKDETDDVVASEVPASEDELSDFIDAGQVEETAETDTQAADIAITSNTDNNAEKAGDKDDDEDSFNGFAGFEEAPATKDETDDVVASEVPESEDELSDFIDAGQVEETAETDSQAADIAITSNTDNNAEKAGDGDDDEDSFNGFAGFEEAPATKDETDDVVASEVPASGDELSDFIDAGQVEETAETDSQAADIAITSNTDNNVEKAGDKDDDEDSFNGFAGFEEAPSIRNETDDVVASEVPTSGDELSDFIDAGQVEETAETDSQAADIAITSNIDNNAEKAGDGDDDEDSFNGFAGFEEAPSISNETDDVVASEVPESGDELSDFIDAGQVEETAETDTQAADIAITSNTDNNAEKAGDKDDDEDSFNGFAGFKEAPATKDETDDVVASEVPTSGDELSDFIDAGQVEETAETDTQAADIAITSNTDNNVEKAGDKDDDEDSFNGFAGFEGAPSISNETDDVVASEVPASGDELSDFIDAGQVEETAETDTQAADIAITSNTDNNAEKAGDGDDDEDSFNGFAGFDEAPSISNETDDVVASEVPESGDEHTDYDVTKIAESGSIIMMDTNGLSCEKEDLFNGSTGFEESAVDVFVEEDPISLAAGQSKLEDMNEELESDSITFTEAKYDDAIDDLSAFKEFQAQEDSSIAIVTNEGIVTEIGAEFNAIEMQNSDNDSDFGDFEEVHECTPLDEVSKNNDSAFVQKATIILKNLFQNAAASTRKEVNKQSSICTVHIRDILVSFINEKTLGLHYCLFYHNHIRIPFASANIAM